MGFRYLARPILAANIC